MRKISLAQTFRRLLSKRAKMQLGRRKQWWQQLASSGSAAAAAIKKDDFAATLCGGTLMMKLSAGSAMNPFVRHLIVSKKTHY